MRNPAMDFEDLLVANAQRGEAENRRIAKLRDGTPAGELKADYLERVYRRKRTKDAIRLLGVADIGPDNPQRAEYQAEVDQIEAELPGIERRLDALGIQIRKKRGPSPN